ncbi:MAG: pyridoxine 5'-phosphate synthase [Xanthomonadaceae bacterium]|nr:pyridoxine 5'-phosphate synthase [Xanthomonadaceae bacterium]
MPSRPKRRPVFRLSRKRPKHEADSDLTALSVNVNKIAVLRNSRGGRDPDVVTAARVCLDAGAHGITVHPRPDARHIRTDDVHALAELTRTYGVEFNIEGNPFAPPRPGYPGFLALCEATRPAQATLVPDDDGQLTSDHGFDFARDLDGLRQHVTALHAIGCRVSVFADAGADIAAAAASGADRIELYTGPYAEAFAEGQPGKVLPVFTETARAAQAKGMGVNAGHDLSQANLSAFLEAVPAVLEVSIGHALIGEALHDGLAFTVKRYLAIVEGR